MAIEKPGKEPQERRDRAKREARMLVHDDETRLTDDERAMYALGWRSGYNSCLRDIERKAVRAPKNS
jgi:hypothetical protein